MKKFSHVISVTQNGIKYTKQFYTMVECFEYIIEVEEMRGIISSVSIDKSEVTELGYFKGIIK
jgi:hypothetical protein